MGKLWRISKPSNLTLMWNLTHRTTRRTVFINTRRLLAGFTTVAFIPMPSCCFHGLIVLLLYCRVNTRRKIFSHPAACPLLPRVYKERVRALHQSCHPCHQPASCALPAYQPFAPRRAIFDPLPFGLGLGYILSSDTSKFAR